MYCEILSIVKSFILLVGDEDTQFKAARQLENMSSEALWRALKSCWLDFYLGPPDIITHDACSNFKARLFQSNVYLLHINCERVPNKAAIRMYLVERYHEPFRRARNIIKTEYPDFTIDESLLGAVKI